MKSLGSLLVKRGWITKQQLGLAISKQREIGGRLGTCLLEMGAIDEDLLDRVLAEQQGVAVASAEDLDAIPEKVHQLLPAPIAIRYRAIPFRATQSEVEIAMLEVDNLWLQDELSFIVGRRLTIHIANEARIVGALAKYYGSLCPERFAKLLERLDRRRREWRTSRHHPESRLVRAARVEKTEAKTAIPPPRTAPLQATPSDRRQPLPTSPSAARQEVERSTIPLSKGELESLGAAPPKPHLSAYSPSAADAYSRDFRAEPALGIGDAATEFEQASDPEEIGKILLDVLSRLFTRVALLRVTAKGLKGWLAEGPGLDAAQFSSYRASFSEPSIFLNLREGGSFFLGVLPAMSPHVALADCWHKDLEDECLVLPVRVRERLVCLVYGDRGPLGLAQIDLAEMRRLTALAATAFESLIMRQKQKREQPSSKVSGDVAR